METPQQILDSFSLFGRITDQHAKDILGILEKQFSKIPSSKTNTEIIAEYNEEFLQLGGESLLFNDFRIFLKQSLIKKDAECEEKVRAVRIEQNDLLKMANRVILNSGSKIKSEKL